MTTQTMDLQHGDSFFEIDFRAEDVISYTGKQETDIDICAIWLTYEIFGKMKTINVYDQLSKDGHVIECLEEAIQDYLEGN